jgi:hypothetical protein
MIGKGVLMHSTCRNALRIAMTMGLLAAFFVLSDAGYAAEHSCSAAEAQRAESEVDGLHSWDTLFKWYTAYSQCDGGGIAEGISEVVARNLVDRWETFPRFVQLAKQTPGFRRFVIQHVDETLDSTDLKTIHVNAAARCPVKLNVFCEDLMKAPGTSRK